MMPNVDPKQMEKLMKQMGIKSRKINAKNVIIETEDQKITITNPDVTEISMQGSISFQIAGEVSVQDSIREEDIKLVSEQAGCSEDEARAALAEADGDIAEAILKLKGEIR